MTDNVHISAYALTVFFSKKNCQRKYHSTLLNGLELIVNELVFLLVSFCFIQKIPCITI